MKAPEIWIGTDRASDEPAYEQLGHLAVFGLTRLSGKTTTLRSIVGSAASGLGADAIVFRSGGEEIPFPGATQIAPVFRDRIDWQSVERMLWTFLSEKNRAYRPLVMKAVKGAKTLEDVHRNVIALGRKSPSAWVKDRTFELDQYFQEIIPWVRGGRLETHLVEPHGVGVMDIVGWPQTVQQLVVTSTMDAVFEAHVAKRPLPLILVLPEARAFVPSDKATPVQRIADLIATQGAKRNLFLAIDSQALTGVNQQVLRNFALLLQGVQTSDLEIRRICKAIDGVKPKMVRELKIGDFIVGTPHGVRTIHVPFLEGVEAVPAPRDVGKPVGKPEENVDAKKEQEYKERIAQLEIGNRNERLALTLKIQDLERQRDARDGRIEDLATQVQDLTVRLAAAKGEPAEAPTPPFPEPDYDTREPATLDAAARARTEDHPGEEVALHVTRPTPSLTIHERVWTIEARDDDSKGRLAILIAEGFLDEPRANSAIRDEFRRRAWGTWIGGGGNDAMSELLQQFFEWRFIDRIQGNKRVDFRAVPEAKARVKVVQERVPA
jgi:hypothetical protein